MNESYAHILASDVPDLSIVLRVKEALNKRGLMVFYSWFFSYPVWGDSPAERLNDDIDLSFSTWPTS